MHQLKEAGATPISKMRKLRLRKVRWYTESTLLHSTCSLSILLCSLDISCFSFSPSHFPLHVYSEEEIIWRAQSTVRVTGRDHKIQIWIRCLYSSYWWHSQCRSYIKRPKTHHEQWVVLNLKSNRMIPKHWNKIPRKGPNNFLLSSYSTPKWPSS